jgi:hypothetical protein
VTEFDSVIRPGGVGKVTASLDTSHYRGPVTKSVRVTASDPAVGPVVLQLKADIVSEVTVAPTDTPVVRTAVGERTPTTLTVSAADGKPFDVLAVRADPRVEVTVGVPPGAAPATARTRKRRDAVATGSSRYLVAITPKADTAAGRSVAVVTLTTTVPRAETVTIRAQLTVVGRVQVVPERLVVVPGPEELHVKLTKTNGDSLEVLGVESSDPEFVATATPIAAGRTYDLAVRYTGKPGRGAVNSRITVRTNEPGQTAIVIPLTGAL